MLFFQKEIWRWPLQQNLINSAGYCVLEKSQPGVKFSNGLWKSKTSFKSLWTSHIGVSFLKFAAPHDQGRLYCFACLSSKSDCDSITFHKNEAIWIFL